MHLIAVYVFEEQKTLMLPTLKCFVSMIFNFINAKLPYTVLNIFVLFIRVNGRSKSVVCEAVIPGDVIKKVDNSY